MVAGCPPPTCSKTRSVQQSTIRSRSDVAISRLSRRDRRRAARSGPRRAGAPDRCRQRPAAELRAPGSRRTPAAISARVFITNGPYCATGSPIGRPCSSSSSHRSVRRRDRQPLVGAQLRPRRGPGTSRPPTVEPRCRGRSTACGWCRVARRRQRPRGAGVHARSSRSRRPASGRARPRVRRRRQRLHARRARRRSRSTSRAAGRVGRRRRGDVLAPQHREVRLDQLVLAGRFSQIWNSSSGFGPVRSSSGNISEWTMPAPAVSHCTSPSPKRAVAPSESE